jgi:hypothetical protein
MSNIIGENTIREVLMDMSDYEAFTKLTALSTLRHGVDDTPSSMETASRIENYSKFTGLNLFPYTTLRGAVLKAGAEWKKSNTGTLTGFAIGPIEKAVEGIMPEALTNQLYFNVLVAGEEVPYIPRTTNELPIIILSQDKSGSMEGIKDRFANSFVYTFLFSASIATRGLDVFHLTFNNRLQDSYQVMLHSKLDMDRLFENLGLWPNGGTVPEAVLKAVENYIQRKEYANKKFFLLYITDAEWDNDDVDVLIKFLQEHRNLYMYLMVFNDSESYLEQVLSRFPRELLSRVKGHTIIGSKSSSSDLMLKYVRDAINTISKDMSKFK